MKKNIEYEKEENGKYILPANKGSITINEAGSKRIVKFELPQDKPNKKIERIKKVLDTLKNGLYSQSSNEVNTLTPLFIIAAPVKIPIPIFHSFVEIRPDKDKFKVLTEPLNKTLENSWLNGKVYISDIPNKLEADKELLKNEKVITDWQEFLKEVGCENEQKQKAESSSYEL